MRASVRLLPLLLFTACSSSQKPFDQMTAQEHLQAAARENALADSNFDKVHGENIAPADTLSTGEVYGFGYDAYVHKGNDADAYIAWARVWDPSEKYEDAAGDHREKALRHERRAAALEGRPSPQPLPPERPPLLEGD